MERGARGEPRVGARLRGSAEEPRLPRDRDRRGTRSGGPDSESEAGRRLQCAARALGRGWLRAGPARNPARALYAFGRACLGARHEQGAGKAHFPSGGASRRRKHCRAARAGSIRPRHGPALCRQAGERRLLRRCLYRARGRQQAAGRTHFARMEPWRRGDGGTLYRGPRTHLRGDGRGSLRRHRDHRQHRLLRL